LIGSFAVTLTIMLTADAGAAVPTTESQITAPGEPTFALRDVQQETLEPFLAIQGTANGEGPLDIRCYYIEEGAEHSALIAGSVVISGGHFAAAFPPLQLHAGPCALRAVPAGDATPHPPGSVSDPFKGPRLVGSAYRLIESLNHKIPADYELESNTLGGRLEITSAGNCGLAYSNLYTPLTLAESDGLFDCNGAIDGDLSDQPQPRAALQIDGANAYTPSAAERVQNLLKNPIPGAPQLTVTHTFDLTTGLVVTHEINPIVRCAPETISPATSTSCTSFVSAGVTLERSWQTSHDDQVAAMSDRWISTNGAAHTLDALYVQESNDNSGAAFEFPGTSTFAATIKGQAITLPAGPGAILLKSHAATPDQGDGANPQGAILYDEPPSLPLRVTRGSGEPIFSTLYMPYQRTIPATGASAMRMTFVQAFALSDVLALAHEALAGYPPTVSITSPASATVATPSVTVSGIATDTGELTSLTVNGSAVSPGAGGAWTSAVPLVLGANTITATATDQAGLASSATITVNYVPPPPRASIIGVASGSGGKVTLVLGCAGALGTHCDIRLLLRSIERLRGHRIVALSARRIHTRQVTIGAYNTTIAAGVRARVTVKLNATGRKLLARFGRLPARLTVTFTDPGARQTLLAQSLTISPLHSHRRRRHR